MGAMCPDYLAQGYQGLHVKQTNKQKPNKQSCLYCGGYHKTIFYLESL